MTKPDIQTIQEPIVIEHLGIAYDGAVLGVARWCHAEPQQHLRAGYEFSMIRLYMPPELEVAIRCDHADGVIQAEITILVNGNLHDETITGQELADGTASFDLDISSDWLDTELAELITGE